MTNPRQFGEFTGFTENEVKSLCKRFNMSYEDTKKWYDGYDLKGISIYNPRSVVMSMTGHDFSNYWTSTENFEALTRYIEMDFDGLKNAVTKCLAGEKIKIDITSFSNDMTTFAAKDDILTLLIHLGYLTYDFETETAWIPNNEITQQFATTIRKSDWNEISKSLQSSDDLLEATLSCDKDKVKEIIDKAHSDNTSVLQYNNAVDSDQMQDLENPCCPNGSPKIKDFDPSGENSLACVISIAYYSARRYYNIYRELPSGKGYADLVFVPRKNVSMPAMFIELKYNKSAETAIKQIKNRRYTDSLKDYHGEVILAGINYNKDDINKNHECRIEKIKI